MVDRNAQITLAEHIYGQAKITSLYKVGISHVFHIFSMPFTFGSLTLRSREANVTDVRRPIQ